MAQFKAIRSGVEVNGQTVLSIVAGMEIFKEIANEILKQNGICDPKADCWYSQQAWLDAFREIAGNVGAFTLFEIGKMIPKNADWPPQVDCIEAALSSIDIAYHMNHRLDKTVLFDPATGKMLEGIDHYGFKKTADRQAIMVCDNPYPSDFDRGIIESAAKKFRSPGDRVQVTLDTASETRKNGADSCTFIVSW